MKKTISSLLLAGMFVLAGCGGATDEAAVDAASPSTAEPCFLNNEVAILAFEWQLTIVSIWDSSDESHKTESAYEFAYRVKDMSWEIPEGSDCIGYRESLVLTKEALSLAVALDEGTPAQRAFEDTAKAGDELVAVMNLEEEGYPAEQVAFMTDPEETRKRLPGQDQ